MALREVTRRGKQVWIDMPPDVCPNRECRSSTGWTPRWRAHDVCRTACRQWQCQACGKLVVDSDHLRDRHGQD